MSNNQAAQSRGMRKVFASGINCLLVLVLTSVISLFSSSSAIAATSNAFDVNNNNTWCTSTLRTMLNSPTVESGFLNPNYYLPEYLGLYFARTNWTAGSENNESTPVCQSRVALTSYGEWLNAGKSVFYNATGAYTPTGVSNVWTRTPVNNSTTNVWTINSTAGALNSTAANTTSVYALPAVYPYAQLEIADGSGTVSDPYTIFNANPELQYWLNDTTEGWLSTIPATQSALLQTTLWGVGVPGAENNQTWADKVGSISYGEWQDNSAGSIQSNYLTALGSLAGTAVKNFWTRTVSTTAGQGYTVDIATDALVAEDFGDYQNYEVLPSVYFDQNVCLETTTDTDAGSSTNPYAPTNNCYSLHLENGEENQLSSGNRQVIIYGTFTDVSELTVGTPVYISAKLGNEIAYDIVQLDSPSDNAVFTLKWNTVDLTAGIYGGTTTPIPVYATLGLTGTGCDPSISFDNCQPDLTAGTSLVTQSNYTGTMTISDGYLTPADLLQIQELELYAELRFAGSIYFKEGTHAGVMRADGTMVSISNSDLAKDYYCYEATGCEHLDASVATANYNQAGDYQIWYKTIAGTGGAPTQEYPFLIQFFSTPASITLSIDNSNPNLCDGQGQSSTLTASTDDGKTYNCSWSPTTGLSDPSSCTTTASPTSTTTYTVEINGCSSSSTITINPIPPTPTVTNTPSCGGATLVASGGSGGTLYYQGTSSTGTSTSDPSTSKSFTSTSATNYYWRSLSNTNGCWSEPASNSPTIYPIPSIVTVSNSGAQCGSTRTLTASGGSGGTIYYQGTTSGGTSTSDTATSKTFSSSSGTVYWRSLSSAGCWGTQGSGYATINPIPAAVTVSTNGVCGTQTLTASGGSGGTIYYQGTTSGGSSTSTAATTAAVSTSGTYYFRSRSTAGCWGTQGGVAVTITSCFPTTMQSMTKAWCNTMSELQTATLTDTRDGKTYRIRKFADGNCWMIDNLAYGSCTASSFGDSYTVGYCRNNPGSATYGYLYNWAMASTVCPSPWALPTGNTSGQFYTLHTAYGSPTPANFWANTSYWNGVYAGYCNNSGALNNQGSNAYYWSSTQYDTGNAYSLYFYTNGYVGPQSGINKDYGFSVRCVL